MYILQVIENPKYLKKPDDQNNHNHYIEDGFDFSIHGDIIINKP
jgi:hypothetical protein